MNNPILKANLKIISELKLFISLISSNPSLLRQFSFSDKSFTRNRKLPFDKLVLLITKLCKKTLSVELDDFFTLLESPCCSMSATIFYMRPTQATIKNLKKSGYIITSSTFLKVRLVRVELNDKVEVLVTNLWQEEGYKTKDFKALYFKRWAIETNISLQKNLLQLESFSGLTPKAVIQDFYATVLIANIQALLIKDAQRTVDKNRAKTKYPKI